MVQRSRLIILGVAVIAVALWGLRPRVPQGEDGPSTTALHHPVDCMHVRAGDGSHAPGWYVDGARLTRDDLRICRGLLGELQDAGIGRGLALE